MAEIDEIDPGLLLGDFVIAENLPMLLRAGVSHVVNCCKEEDCLFRGRFLYRHLKLDDSMTENILPHIPSTNE